MTDIESWIQHNLSPRRVSAYKLRYGITLPPGQAGIRAEIEEELTTDKKSAWFWMSLLQNALTSLDGAQKVLDIGCGPGWPAIPLACYVQQVVAVEASEKLLEKASANLAKRGFQNVCLLRADAESLPFADGTFEGVVMGEVLDVFYNPVQALTEALRVLEPSGRLVTWVQDFAYVLSDCQSTPDLQFKRVDDKIYLIYWKNGLKPPHEAEYWLEFDENNKDALVALRNFETQTELPLEAFWDLCRYFKQNPLFYRNKGYSLETLHTELVQMGFINIEIGHLDTMGVTSAYEYFAQRELLGEIAPHFDIVCGALAAAERSLPVNKAWLLVAKAQKPL